MSRNYATIFNPWNYSKIAWMTVLATWTLNSPCLDQVKISLSPCQLFPGQYLLPVRFESSKNKKTMDNW